MWNTCVVLSCLAAVSLGRIISDDGKPIERPVYQDENGAHERFYRLSRGFLRDYVQKTIQEELDRYYDNTRKNEDAKVHEAEMNALMRILRRSDQPEPEDAVRRHYVALNVERLKRIVRNDFNNFQGYRSSPLNRDEYVRRHARIFRNFLRRDYETYKRAVLPRPSTITEEEHHDGRRPKELYKRRTQDMMGRSLVGHSLPYLIGSDPRRFLPSNAVEDIPRAREDVEVKGIPVVIDISKKDVPRIHKKDSISRLLHVADVQVKKVTKSNAGDAPAKTTSQKTVDSTAESIAQMSSSDAVAKKIILKSAADAPAQTVARKPAADAPVKKSVLKPAADVPIEKKAVPKPAADVSARKADPKPAADVPAKKAVSKPAADVPAKKAVPKPSADVPAKKAVPKPAADVPAKEVVAKPGADVPSKKVVGKPAADVPARKAVPKPAADVPAKKAVPKPAADVPARKAVPRPAADVPAKKAAPKPAADVPAAVVQKPASDVAGNPLLLQSKSRKDQLKKQLLMLMRDDLTEDQLVLLRTKLDQLSDAEEHVENKPVTKQSADAPSKKTQNATAKEVADISQKAALKPVADVSTRKTSLKTIAKSLADSSSMDAASQLRRERVLKDARRDGSDYRRVERRRDRVYDFPIYDGHKDRGYAADPRIYRPRDRLNLWPYNMNKFPRLDYASVQQHPLLRRKYYGDRHYDEDLDDLSASVSGVRNRRSHHNYDNLFRDEPGSSEPEVINVARP